jgi:uroporphyrinogen III methyltransferase/synthase
MRVLITRPREQAAAFAAVLINIGLEPVFFPAIEIKPLADTTCIDRALSQLDNYDWLIFTSANAVDVVIRRMADLGISSPPKEICVAAIGPKTAARLKDGGILADFIPDQYVAEAILPGLGELHGRWVLLPTADIAHDTLPDAIQNIGGIAHVVTAYHTLPAELDSEGFAAIQEGVDYITFTSSSTVRNFYSLVQEAGLNPLQLPGEPKLACIGPKTELEASRLGFRVAIVAEPHTTDGLITAIQSQNLQEA